MNVNIVVGLALGVLMLWVLYMAYQSSEPLPPPPPKVIEKPPPPPSAPVNVATFIDPVVHLDGTSGTDAKLTVLAGRTMGYIPSTTLADVGDGSVVQVSGPTALPITQAMPLENLALMVKSVYENANPGQTIQYETGTIVDGDSVDLRFRYFVNGQFHHVDAQRHNFSRSGSEISYQGNDGKNSGLYVLPIEILQQYSALELWPTVQGFYINLFGTNAIHVQNQKVDNYSADYEFNDTVNGPQRRRYTFERNQSGAVEVKDQGEAESAYSLQPTLSG